MQKMKKNATQNNIFLNKCHIPLAINTFLAKKFIHQRS